MQFESKCLHAYIVWSKLANIEHINKPEKMTLKLLGCAALDKQNALTISTRLLGWQANIIRLESPNISTYQFSGSERDRSGQQRITSCSVLK